MSNTRFYIFLSFLCVVSFVYGQRDYRDYLRRGNKLYADSIFDKSEIEYRKALEKDVNGANALYNLGNSLLLQNKAEDAMNQYQIAEKRENDSAKLSQIHHNMGVIHHGSKNYAQAVEAYKQALRENPGDNETRYNLVLAMKQLKEQQQQQQDNQQQDNQQQQEQKQQEQQQNKEQQNKQDNQQQQEQNQQEQKQQEQNQQEQQQNKQEMSKENAEQILQAAMQDEKDVQEKVKKMMQLRGRKLEKDW